MLEGKVGQSQLVVSLQYNTSFSCWLTIKIDYKDGKNTKTFNESSECTWWSFLPLHPFFKITFLGPRKYLQEKNPWIQIHNRKIHNWSCSRGPVNSLTGNSFLMAIDGEKAFWALGKFVTAKPPEASWQDLERGWTAHPVSRSMI